MVAADRSRRTVPADDLENSCPDAAGRDDVPLGAPPARSGPCPARWSCWSSSGQRPSTTAVGTRNGLLDRAQESAFGSGQAGSNRRHHDFQVQETSRIGRTAVDAASAAPSGSPQVGTTWHAAVTSPMGRSTGPRRPPRPSLGRVESRELIGRHPRAARRERRTPQRGTSPRHHLKMCVQMYPSSEARGRGQIQGCVRPPRV